MPTLFPALLALACTDGSGSEVVLEPIDFQVVMSEVVSTVPTVSWQAEGIEDAWVVVHAPDGSSWRVGVDLEDAPSFETSILGMKGDAVYGLSVEARVADGVRESDIVEVTTGTPPNTLPEITVEALDPSRMHRGYYGFGLPNPSGGVIVDSDGDYVWWYLSDKADQGVVRLIVSQDGETILMGGMNTANLEYQPLVRVSYDGSELTTYDAPWRHHDFTELPDGTVAYLTDDPREVDGQEVRGDQLVELAPDGKTTSVYSVWQDHDFVDNGDLPSQDQVIGWPHANYVEYLPQDDDYLVSFLHLKGIARIDRATGTQEWFLGGPDSTMVDSRGESTFFDKQHGLELQEDSIVVFVNGKGDLESRAVEVQLDPEAGTAETTWEYWPEPSLGSPVLGDVHRFENNDNTLVTFSFSGAVHEVDPSGEPVWTLYTELGGAMTFLTYMKRLQPE